MSAANRGLLARIRAFGRARGIEDAEAFLQRRVRLFFAVGFIITSGLWLRWLLYLVFLGDRALIFQQPTNATQPVLALAIGAGWLYLRGKPRSASVVYAFEAAINVGACLVYSLVVHLDPNPSASQPLLIGANHALAMTLLARAVLVPSSAWRTFAVGALCLGPLMASSLYVPETAFATWGIRPINYTNMWGITYGALTVITSWVIYGLQARVRDALELGQYRLVEKLGEGGMGAVYRAEHRMLRRSTAIKLIHPEQAGEAAIVRFEREVRLTSQLKHPNTVAIYDYGRTPDGIFYYAMEHLEGLDLKELVELAGPQPPGRVIHILEQAAFALAEAHALGLIHRDVKPSNLMLTDRGGVADLVKVVDFGLVKDIGGARDAGLSRTDAVVGTPLYMAPEAMSDPQTVDPRADLYALGAVGYFLITGTHVFEGATMLQVLSDHLQSEPERPSDRLGREMPRDLETLLLKCLAKRPSDRYPDAMSLRAALLDCKAASEWSLHLAGEWWEEHVGAIRTLRAEKKKDVSSDSAGLLTIAMKRAGSSEIGGPADASPPERARR